MEIGALLLGFLLGLFVGVIRTNWRLFMAEITVEEALKELREMFPRRWIRITCSTHSAKTIKTEWMISIDKVIDDFDGSALSDCMTQIRKWKEENNGS